MSILDLEKSLFAAQERLKKAAQALVPKHEEREWEEYESAYAAVLSLERALASAKGEEYAIPLDFPIRWDIGAPLPHVLMSDSRTLLAFYIRVSDSNCNSATVKPSGGESVEPLALVEFYGCISAKMGSPNDEVFGGHPLSGKGLDAYTAQIVQNSRWIAELEAINRIHEYYNPDNWRKLKHYIFWFHDSTFECVAKSYNVEIFHGSMSDLLARACKRLLE